LENRPVWLVATQHEPRQHFSNLSCDLFGKLEALTARDQIGGVDSEGCGDSLDPVCIELALALLELLDLLA
jgi:hypothetical protein